jgi:hypothetical protein
MLVLQIRISDPTNSKMIGIPASHSRMKLGSCWDVGVHTFYTTFCPSNICMLIGHATQSKFLNT